MDLTIMKLWKVIVILASLAYLGEARPVYASPRWFDYDNFPVAKAIHTEDRSGISDDTETIIVPTVNPLRPYEPWILDCILFSSDKVEPGRRHESCKDVDEQNEKEYGKYLLHVSRWEEAYHDRAARWNARFPDAKEKEKKRYEQLKGYAEFHKIAV